jgi:hypothetical protein
MESIRATGKPVTSYEGSRPWYESLALTPLRAMESLAQTVSGVGARLRGQDVEQARSTAILGGQKVDTGAKWANITGDILGEVAPAIVAEALTAGIAPAAEALIATKIPSLGKWIASGTKAVQYTRTGIIGGLAGGGYEAFSAYGRGETAPEIIKHTAIGTALGAGFNVAGDMLMNKLVSKLRGQDFLEEVVEATYTPTGARTIAEELGRNLPTAQLPKDLTIFAREAAQEGTEAVGGAIVKRADELVPINVQTRPGQFQLEAPGALTTPKQTGMQAPKQAGEGFVFGESAWWNDLPEDVQWADILWEEAAERSGMSVDEAVEYVNKTKSKLTPEEMARAVDATTVQPEEAVKQASRATEETLKAEQKAAKESAKEAAKQSADTARAARNAGINKSPEKMNLRDVLKNFQRVMRESDELAFTGKFGQKSFDDLMDATAKGQGRKVDFINKAMDDAKRAERIAYEAVNSDVGAAFKAFKELDAVYSEIHLHTATQLFRRFQLDKNVDKMFEVAKLTMDKSLDIPMIQLRNAHIYSMLDDDMVEPFMRKFVKDAGGDPAKHMSKELTDEVALRLKELKNMPLDENRAISTLGMVTRMVDEVPTDVFAKLGTIEKMSMLSGTVGRIRDLVSNLVHLGYMTVADIPGVGLDIFISTIKGTERTKVLGDLINQAYGLTRGARLSTKSVFRGVNLGKSTYEMTNSPLFKSQVMKAAQKALGIQMEVADQAVYWAKLNDEILGQMKIKGMNPATEIPTLDMLKDAHFFANEVVYKNENLASDILVNLSKKLNKISTLGMTEQVGLGNFFIPFAKTLTNVAKNTIDYSPVGLLKGMWNVSRVMVADAGKVSTRKLQRKAVEQISKAFVGTGGLMYFGYFGANMGFISPGGEYESDIDPIKNQQGMGKARINLTAMWRGLMSGFQDMSATQPKQGDKIVSYNWLLPFGTLVGMGAGVSKRKKEAIIAGEDFSGVTAVMAAASGMFGDFQEDTVYGSFINTLTKNMYEDDGWFLGRLKTYAGDWTARFIPTFLSQFRKAVDNTSRRTFDEDWKVRLTNMLANKIPGLSKQLEANYTPFGEVIQLYPDDTNRVFRSFFASEAINYYDLGTSQEFLLSLYEAMPEIEYPSKEEKEKQELINAFYNAVGKKAPKSPQQLGEGILPPKYKYIRSPGDEPDHQMTNAEKIVYQTSMNDRVIAGINNLVIDPAFTNANPDKQLELVKGVIKKSAEDVEAQWQIDLWGYAFQPYGSNKKKKTTKTKTSPSKYMNSSTKSFKAPTSVKSAPKPIKSLTQ